MTSFTVTISQMHGASGKIARAVADFQQAARQVLQCAEALGASWEGDSHEAFIAEQRHANEWYNRMMEIVNEYVATINTAADDYQAADDSAASIIRGN